MALRKVVPANAGETSKRTLALRAPLPLNKKQRTYARRLRQQGHDFAEIAKRLVEGFTEEDVQLSLANMRSKRGNPPRYSLNVSEAVKEKVMAARRPGEAVWRTANRLFGITS